MAACLASAVAALEQNTGVTTLNLRGNQIGTQGAERLAAALEHNTGVTTLDLRGNQIGAQGAERQCKCCKRSTERHLLWCFLFFAG